MSPVRTVLRNELEALRAWEEGLADILEGIRKNEASIQRRILALDDKRRATKIGGMKLTKADDLLYHLVGADGTHLACVSLAAATYAPQVELFFGVAPCLDTLIGTTVDEEGPFTNCYLCPGDNTRWDLSAEQAGLTSKCPTCGKGVNPFASHDRLEDKETILDQTIYNQANVVG